MSGRRTSTRWRVAGLSVVALLCVLPGRAAESDLNVPVQRDPTGDLRLEIIVYPAVAAPGAQVVIEGRVIRPEERSPLDAQDGKRRNLKRNLQLLMNREVANVPLTASLGDAVGQGITDVEGYYRIELPTNTALEAGWRPVLVEARGYRGEGAVLVVAAGATEGVISDIDDTLLVTGVTRKRSLLKNSLLRNALQRQPVERMPELLNRLVADAAAAGCCVFYLSGTPRQMHDSVQAFLQHQGFPPGVLITKRITDDSSSESLRDQRQYKLARLEEILERLPQLTFTLLGDDAEADPEIYAEIARRHPQRVRGIWIREVGSGARGARVPGQGSMAELIATTLDCAPESSANCETR